MYNNGQRKAMMYGGAAKRKPMMYGGMATKKPRKKAQAGGMMMSAPQEPLFKQPMQPAMGMGMESFEPMAANSVGGGAFGSAFGGGW